MDGSFDSFLIVFHTLRLLCVIFLHHSVNQFVSRFYGSASKGLLLMIALVGFI